MARHSACKRQKKAMLSGKTSLNTPKIRAGTSLGIWPCSFLCDYRRNQTAMKKKGTRACIDDSKFRNPTNCVGHPCHQDEAGPCWWCVSGHDVYPPGRAYGRQRSNRDISFPENKNIGLLRWKHPYFWGKTSVLLPKEVRCFAVSGPLHRILPSPPLYKKSFWKSPTFPTPQPQMPCIY